MNKRLSPVMRKALLHYQETGSREGIRRNTLAALEARQLIPVQAVSEIIDAPRPSRYQVNWYDDVYRLFPTHDIGQANYGYYDRARRGKVKGLELAGLLLRPLESKKAAWVIGTQPKFKFKRPKTQELFTTWFGRHHADILRGYQESVGLGDCYLVINPPAENGDLSVTVVPPHVVMPLVDERDYSKQIGWTILETHAHPTRPGDVMTIRDDYSAEKRVRTIMKNGVQLDQVEYPNLIKRVPVVHIPHDRGSDEKFGHPIGEALIHMLMMYGEVLLAALQGNIKQGRPTPVIEQMGGIEQIAAFWDRFGTTKTRIGADGKTETYTVLNLSSDNTITLGATATFKYAQPGSFSADTVALLGLMFYLYIQHSEFPEFIMGNAIASSKASAESQMPPFVKFIEKSQGDCNSWVIEMVMIVIGYLSLYERGVAANDEPLLQWPRLTGSDGQLTLDAIKLGLERSLIDDETALTLMPLDIDDPKAVLEKVKREIEEKRSAEAERDRQADIEVPDIQDDSDAEMSGAFKTRLLEADNPDGIMVAFMLDGTAANSLAQTLEDVEGAIEAEDMHLTLAYVGKVDDVDFTEEDLMQAVGDFAQGEHFIEGIPSGIGLFTRNPGVNVFYASFDAPDLAAFREGLIDALEDANIPVDRQHGFQPHVTLAYLPKDAEMPLVELPDDLTFVFRQITVAWGENRTSFDLKGKRMEAVA